MLCLYNILHMRRGRANAACALPGCQLPVWVDQKGRPSQFCTRAHRDQMAATGKQRPPAYAATQPPQALAPQPAPTPIVLQAPAALFNPYAQLCKYCKTKPVYVDRSNVPFVVHSFCGRTCASAHILSGGG
ncbi:hypothetical protein PsYK624_119690 [Phanerochaete sordida]|uniref:Uncharacterized protein n=1 Tax=Phanerochaete sordida TaxID=48140 RepID=A0A9P3GIV7_9APHY|nr:hypothetical protein PsYK624_119690 [Phanerochaete sordida]